MSSDDTSDPSFDRNDRGFPDFVPFNEIRGVKLPSELVTSRRLVDSIATALEESTNDLTKLLEHNNPVASSVQSSGWKLKS